MLSTNVLIDLFIIVMFVSGEVQEKRFERRRMNDEEEGKKER
jgi:hypothetical protein